MKVVNCKQEDYDVLICRPSIWGNPYTHISDRKTLAEFIVPDRETAIAKYREYLLNHEYLMSKLNELDGKILGCVCINGGEFPIPFRCHGQVIIEVLQSIKFKSILTKQV